MIDYKKFIKEYKDFPIKDINYLDMNPIYKDSQLRNRLVEDCIKKLKKFNFNYIGVIESRGFLIGSILAHELQKGIVLLRSKKIGYRVRLTQ